MKKLLLIVMMVLMPAVIVHGYGYNYPGEGEAQANAPTTASSTDEVHAALARIEGKLNKKGRSGGSEARIKQSMLQHAKYADNKAAEHTLGLHNHMSESFWMTLVVILVAAIIIIGVGVFFYRRIQRDARGFFPRLWNTAGNNLQVATDTYRSVEVTRNAVNAMSAATSDSMSGISDQLTAGFAAVQASLTSVSAEIATIPEKTASAVKAFNSAPIDVSCRSHRAVFTQSADATAKEVYQYIWVGDDVDPTATAKDYEFHTSSDRNVAHDKLRQVIREYHNGSLKKKADAGSVSAKLTIEIVEYLRDTTKQLVITKL